MKARKLPELLVVIVSIMVIVIILSGYNAGDPTHQPLAWAPSRTHQARKVALSLDD